MFVYKTTELFCIKKKVAQNIFILYLWKCFLTTKKYLEKQNEASGIILIIKLIQP